MDIIIWILKIMCVVVFTVTAIYLFFRFLNWITGESFKYYD